MFNLSVALCTYNGSGYLPDQLNSIAAQTRLPDELIICDDVSQDNTVAIARRFAARATFPVRVTINAETMGTTRNFDRAIGLCQGDVIVLSDQDDVWRPKKLAVLEAAFQSSPKIGAVFSDAELVDATLAPLGYTLWQALGFSMSEQKRMSKGQELEVLFRHNVVAGATLALRSSFRELLLPIPPAWLHDGWIALMIGSQARIAAIPDRLILYRQHSSNQVGAILREPMQKWIEHKTLNFTPYKTYCHQLELLRKRLLEHPSIGACQVLSRIEEKTTHIQFRASLPDQRWRRITKVLAEIVTGRYFRYSNGFQSVLKDLLIKKH